MYRPPPTVYRYACIMHATAQNKARSQASNAAKATTDQTDQKEPKPQNQKEKQKGLGANPGHETSQNSHSPSDKTFCEVTSLGPFLGGQLLVRYVAIAPLSGSALHIFKLHFCKCIRPLPGIVADSTWQHSGVALWPIWSSQTPIP